MGSFQQISIGIICLVAAFAFGNYVNTQPVENHPTNDVAAVLQTEGNVQSRLIDGIELVEKRPASIATMRNRLEPRFSMPQTDSAPIAVMKEGSGSLPPPSQLDSKPSPNSGLAARSNANKPAADLDAPQPRPDVFDQGKLDVTPRIAKASDIPDFSSIMNELEGSPIALNRLGKMPQHSKPTKNRAAQAIPKPNFENAEAPLKTPAGQTAQANPWNTQQQAEFSAEDFAPQLKDKFSNAEPEPMESTDSNSIVEPTELSKIPGAANTGPFPDQANHIVSRAPIPNNSSWEQGNSVSTQRQYERSPHQRVAQAIPREDYYPEQVAPPLPDSYTAQSENNVLSTNQPGNTVRTKLPFGLNDEGKKQLASIRSRTNSQLALTTTRFVDHVVQQGETLQSISKRYFGNPNYYLDIYLANRNKLKNPIDIRTGIALKIPIYE